MPPIRNKNRKNLDEQEGRILLAISDLQNGRIQRVAQAARIYEIPRTTLQDRLNGIQQRSLVRANSHKLTQYEEESLVKWVLDLDRRGLPPRHSLVREMANYILSQHGKPQVGKNWITKLIKRRPEIDSKFARKYNYERAKCEDPKIIQEHFDRVQAAISEYGILPEDIFNFDETGFAMGLCATAKVITGSDRYAQPKLLQPGNREWVTAIEATNSTGWAVPSYVIFKAKKNVREGWFDDLPDDWRINISDNGWTTDQIGLEWLKTHFIPYINGRTVGKYRMLILDGHGSHLTPEFDHICTENNIIPVCMPPHSSHLLQPLDVGCFAVLKRHYGQLVEQRMRLGFNHIDKMDFLTAFPQARTVAYKAQTIWNSFAATGLVPFNPDRVIQQLNIRLKTPTPPPSRSSNTASSCLQTPQNIRQFIRQSTTINKRINERTESNQNQEINQAVVRLSKAYEMIANDVLLVRKENYDLRAAHEKEKQKRQKSKKQISIEQAVTKEEVQALVQGQVEASHAVTTTPAEPELPASQAVVRRQYRCSELTNALVVLVWCRFGGELQMTFYYEGYIIFKNWPGPSTHVSEWLDTILRTNPVTTLYARGGYETQLSKALIGFMENDLLEPEIHYIRSLLNANSVDEIIRGEPLLVNCGYATGRPEIYRLGPYGYDRNKAICMIRCVRGSVRFCLYEKSHAGPIEGTLRPKQQELHEGMVLFMLSDMCLSWPTESNGLFVLQTFSCERQQLRIQRDDIPVKVAPFHATPLIRELEGSLERP
ncbi:pogo transposable element, putative [Talaromyces stipitatus ATCC 10500]|uniref:Pogo transposable element, putative n=1 Tax=Talaromyces stipitatus (strain ATCC 10500 / CBS 375.48 / QM 6759 / NRRL 1006) TaxID=441959 RepID=B8MM24_TALSN|nr:pogo transposable element, putative [Talaromyces stipitatus ATCC 10500]EED13536.1 pogo transposable element, putative [Talaromyces stipitatus ATCC 10500]